MKNINILRALVFIVANIGIGSPVYAICKMAVTQAAPVLLDEVDFGSSGHRDNDSYF